MTRRTLGLIGLALIAGIVCWAIRAHRAPHYANDPPRAGRTWVAFGDSLTAGTGASPGHDYPTQLGQRLGVSLINAGVPGETSADGRARVEAIRKLEPRVVLLCLGGNDGLQQVPLSETLANLGAIIDRLQASGAFVVLIGIRSASAIDQYAGPFRNLARQHRALYIPNLLAGILAHPRLMSDSIHPNDDGYALIAARLAEALRPRLPALKPPATTTDAS